MEFSMSSAHLSSASQAGLEHLALSTLGWTNPSNKNEQYQEVCSLTGMSHLLPFQLNQH